MRRRVPSALLGASHWSPRVRALRRRLPARSGAKTRVGAARRSRQAQGHKTLWSSGFRGEDSSKAILLRVSQRKRPLPDHLLGKKEENRQRL